MIIKTPCLSCGNEIYREQDLNGYDEESTIDFPFCSGDCYHSYLNEMPESDPLPPINADTMELSDGEESNSKLPF